jgi:hypothetical protein
VKFVAFFYGLLNFKSAAVCWEGVAAGWAAAYYSSRMVLLESIGLEFLK